MLDLIVKTSSNENSIVLACFCGIGTTLKATQLLNHKWVGIDQSYLAMEATKQKMAKIHKDLFDKKVRI